MIQHIVLFTPKATLAPDVRRTFATLVLDTLRASTHISRCTVGKREPINPGYDRSLGDKTYEYAAVLEFESKDRLISYLNEPKHAQLGKAFWEFCESTVVCEVQALDFCDEKAASILVE